LRWEKSVPPQHSLPKIVTTESSLQLYANGMENLKFFVLIPSSSSLTVLAKAGPPNTT